MGYDLNRANGTCKSFSRSFCYQSSLDHITTNVLEKGQQEPLKPHQCNIRPCYGAFDHDLFNYRYKSRNLLVFPPGRLSLAPRKNAIIAGLLASKSLHSSTARSSLVGTAICWHLMQRGAIVAVECLFPLHLPWPDPDRGRMRAHSQGQSLC